MSEGNQPISQIVIYINDEAHRQNLISLINASEFVDTKISLVQDVESLKSKITPRDAILLFVDFGELDVDGDDLKQLIYNTNNAAILFVAPKYKPERVIRAVECGAQDCLFLNGLTSTSFEATSLAAIARLNFNQNQEKLSDQLAKYDQLIGIPNRVYFKELLSHQFNISQNWQNGNSHTPIVLSLISLEGIGIVKESYGQGVLDLLFVSIGARLKQELNHYDIVARWSENVFALLFVNHSDGICVSDSVSQFQNLLTTLERPVDLIQREVNISCSIGVCTFEKSFSDIDAMISGCEIALKDAKGQGKSCFKFFSQSLNDNARERIALSSSLQSAIKKNQLSLYYQPIVIGGTQIVSGAEALIRWQKPDGSWVNPEQIIELAEQLNLIHELGFWIIETALKVLGSIRQQGRPNFKMAINLSPKQIGQEEFSQQVSRLIDQYHCPPDALEFELIEKEMMEDLEISLENLKKLRELGIGISIDDFGTGHSSLEYLRYLPVNCLKIDRSFINDLPNSAADQTVVKAIIGLAHNLRLKVIAEGVENSEQLDFLSFYLNTDDELQGFHFSQPLDVNDFFRYLKRGF